MDYELATSQRVGNKTSPQEVTWESTLLSIQIGRLSCLCSLALNLYAGGFKYIWDFHLGQIFNLTTLVFFKWDGSSTN